MQNSIGTIIKYARKEYGLTQKELAEKLGVATGTVQQWELGKRYPRIPMIKKIEKLFGVSLVADPEWDEKLGMWIDALNASKEASEHFNGEGITEISFEQVYTEQQVYLENRMHKAFSALNEEGQFEACKRVEQMADTKEYRRITVAPSPDESHDEKDEKT